MERLVASHLKLVDAHLSILSQQTSPLGTAQGRKSAPQFVPTASHNVGTPLELVGSSHGEIHGHVGTLWEVVGTHFQSSVTAQDAQELVERSFRDGKIDDTRLGLAIRCFLIGA